MRENEERWKQLCKQAANEHDPQKLLELTREINELLLSKRDPGNVEPTLRSYASVKPCGYI
jgi:hypothetical protein